MDLAEGGSDHFFHNKLTADYTVRVVRHIAGLVRIQLHSEMRAVRGIGPQFPSVLQVGDSRRCHVNSLPNGTSADSSCNHGNVELAMSDTSGYLIGVYRSRNCEETERK